MLRQGKGETSTYKQENRSNYISKYPPTQESLPNAMLAASADCTIGYIIPPPRRIVQCHPSLSWTDNDI